MCGRYASARSVDDIASAFGIVTGDDDVAAAPDWNVAPTKPVTAVVERDGHRRLTTMRWGLVPSWADDPSVGSRMINARMETVADKPAYREALLRRRCLLPADGWYEWQSRPDGVRQPHYLAPDDGRLLAFAALWETWLDAEGRPLVTTTIVTGPAPPDLAHVHDRAPVLLTQPAWAAWLSADARAGVELLRPTPAGAVVAHPVGPAVGDVRANGPQLTEPVAVDEQQPLF
jgi:putative SOS response-associated peptidase YedK